MFNYRNKYSLVFEGIMTFLKGFKTHAIQNLTRDINLFRDRSFEKSAQLLGFYSMLIDEPPKTKQAHAGTSRDCSYSHIS